MPKTIKMNTVTGNRAEAVAVEVLRAAEFAVTNLNELVRNFPLADLVARRGSDRLLVQVRGTTTRAQWFQISSQTAQNFARLADELGHQAVYAFVGVDGVWPTVRFGTADDVADAALDSFVTGSYYEGVSMDDVAFVAVGQIDTLLTEDD